jgi:hypothetical protein
MTRCGRFFKRVIIVREQEKFEEYTIAYDVESHVVDFSVYKITGYTQSEKGKYDAPIYTQEN